MEQVLKCWSKVHVVIYHVEASTIYDAISSNLQETDLKILRPKGQLFSHVFGEMSLEYISIYTGPYPNLNIQTYYLHKIINFCLKFNRCLGWIHFRSGKQ